MYDCRDKHTWLMFGDCLERMKEIPDDSVNFVCVDPPYGMTASKWDSMIDFDLMWRELSRISKINSAIAVFASHPFTTKLIHSNMDEFKYCWYWIKNQATNFFHAKRMPLRRVEEICVFGKHDYFPQKSRGHAPTNSAIGSSPGNVYHGSNTRNYSGGSTTRYPTNVLEFKCVSNYSRLHPNEKPVALMEYLIKTYTTEGDTVLDFAMGSGTTGVACRNLGRKFIGIELDEDYFKIAKDRILSVETCD